MIARTDPPRPVVTWIFLGLCFLITVPAIFFPEFREVVRGVEPRQHPWQLFTSVFLHGWPGFPAAAHLLLNSILILECGQPCERLLGSGRFLILSVAAWLACAFVQTLGEGVNGSSQVIWAWGPPLVLALRHREAVGFPSPGRDRVRVILMVMYMIIPVGMTAMIYASGWQGNPLVGLVLANQFHLTATIVGAVFTWLTRAWTRRHLRELDDCEQVFRQELRE